MSAIRVLEIAHGAGVDDVGDPFLALLRGDVHGLMERMQRTVEHGRAVCIVNRMPAAVSDTSGSKHAPHGDSLVVEE